MVRNGAAEGHRISVRLTHWIVALAVIVLFVSGFVILMAHPRLYWGETGNDLTQPLFELPLGKNYKHGGWENEAPFYQTADSPVTAERSFEIYNQNGWARSLHFLAAWIFLAGIFLYWTLGLFSGHLRRDLWPGVRELAPQNIWRDVKAHVTLKMPDAKPGPPYDILQKLTYAAVVFLALPLMFLTGVTMSPAISASFPVLLDIFGGTQSARTIHFLTFSFLVLFLFVHLAMIMLTGPVRQLRAMIWGK